MVSRGSWLPDVRHDLTAHPTLARLVARHHPARGGHDGRAHSAEDSWDIVLRHVAAPARAGDALHAADHRVAVLGVAEADPDHLTHPRGLHAEVGDIALLLEDAGHLALQAGRGDVHLLVLGEERVADPVQVIGDRVGQHQMTPSLVMVGVMSLPTGLGHSGYVAAVSGVAQADPAEAEL